MPLGGAWGVGGAEERFAEFFKRATGHEAFRYQVRMGTGKRFPELLNVPTGAGKTVGALVE